MLFLVLSSVLCSFRDLLQRAKMATIKLRQVKFNIFTQIFQKPKL